MGVPIVAAKQQWQYLDPPIKNKLPGLLKKYLPELPQVEIFYRCGVTSMDVFVSLTALLETGLVSTILVLIVLTMVTLKMKMN